MRYMKRLLLNFLVLVGALSSSIPAIAKESANGPLFTVGMPEDSIACESNFREELIVIYGKYNSAARSGDFEEFQKQIIDHQAKGMREALTYQGKVRDAKGTIVFKKENGRWKVQNSVWNPQF